MLWLALYMPLLPLESAASATTEQPLVVYTSHAGQHSVYRLNAAAAARGIDPGMPLTAARSLCQTLHAIEHDARREQHALEGLALWAMSFTSRVSLQPPQGLILEIGASLTLFGGLDALRETMQRSLDALGFSAHRGIAPTPMAAWLLALEQRGRSVTRHDELRGALLPLPLSLLPIDRAQKTTLSRLGLQHIRDCLRLPRDGLTRRLGPQLLDCLDRALGQAPDARSFYSPPERFQAQVLLPEPVIHVQPLLFVLKRLLGQLAGFLRARDAAAQRLQLGLIKPFLPIETLQLTLLQPGRDPEQLFSLWRERLERHTLDAAVEGLELRVSRLLPLQPRSSDLLGAPSSGDDFMHTLERLRNRLGEQVIHQPISLADHRPERAGQQVAFPAHWKVNSLPPLLRPLWLLPTPQALAQDSHGAPLLHGPLTLLSSPERIEAGWWDSGDLRRDYYVAQNPRRQRLWIYRQAGKTPAWFLHGLFA